ncbi:ELMO/CED-12 family domain-containing protein [Ditylenchus destructor]|uniref:ELMO/CED-12 family domain-containing protein n=1 Tax=Ditylenchus destructor TaxID=166010 RepID=A0AAD4R088_9BILA|nr:ELMO/CED-12 family domain-containing protein [Ditylenchus destructor]
MNSTSNGRIQYRSPIELAKTEIALSNVRLESKDLTIEFPESRKYSSHNSLASTLPNSQRTSVDGQMAASSFQSVWTKLTVNTDFIAEKTIATREMLDSREGNASPVSSKSLFTKLPSYFACGLPSVKKWMNRHQSMKDYPLRSSALADEQVLIIAVSKVAYSNTEPVHWELLSSIYRHIAQSISDDRYGAHWEKIGFQGSDPALDLRGVGVFGLCQLLFLVSNGLTSQMIDQLLQMANNPLQGFPFAVVGLNWTQMILERVKRGKLNHLATKENSFISCVNGIYRGCFIVFLKFWKTRKCTIADFGGVANEIKDLIRRRPKYLLNMAILGTSID